MNKINLKDKGLFTMVAFILLFFSNCNSSTPIKSQTNKKSSFKNYLENTTWVITNEKIIGFNPESIYKLTPKTDSIKWNYYAIEFINSVNYTSYDTWECGNDCFTATYGHYEFIAKDKIRLYADSISRRGTCEEPTKHLTKKTNEIFTISKNKNKVILTKSQ